jgi:hypothetical protein
VTQPPDDSTRRFEPFRDDDSTRAMPPVPPADDDDATRVFPFDDDRTRQFSAQPDATRAYPADATTAMPPVGGGPVRGSATPVTPGGYGGNVYGGTTRSEYDRYDEEEPEPERGGKRTALIVGGVILVVLLVTGVGYAVSSALFGSSATPTPTLSALPSASAEPSAAPSPSATEQSESPPPPEGPGPRIIRVGAPAQVDCTAGGTRQFDVQWRVADAHSVHISMDGTEYQRYAPGDEPVSLPFPCDGQAHKYQVTAFSNDDRQSQTSQFTVQPAVAQSEAPQPLFPAPSPS